MTGFIKQLYSKARSKVLTGNDYRNWFRATTGVRQGCTLCQILFNSFLERKMIDALYVFTGEVKFIDLLATNKDEVNTVTIRQDKTS